MTIGFQQESFKVEVRGPLCVCVVSHVTVTHIYRLGGLSIGFHHN